MLHVFVMLTQLAQIVLCRSKLPAYCMQLHCALGLVHGAPVVAELCLQLTQDKGLRSNSAVRGQPMRTPRPTARPPFIQTEPVTSSCVPLHFRVLVYDLTFALESLFAAEGRSCPFFFRNNNDSDVYTDSCLCLIARDQQHSEQASKLS